MLLRNRVCLRHDDYFLTFIEASVPTHRVGHTFCPFVVSERISQHGGGIMDTTHVLMVIQGHYS